MSEATAILTNEQNGQPSLSEFFDNEGRLPRVTDEVKPWEYRGWLLPYRIMAESHPEVAPRYAYVIATLEAGKLLDEPPPRIDFLGEFDPQCKPGLKQITEMMKIVEYRSTSWDAFRDICAWIGYALGATSEVSTLAADIQEKLYRLFDLGPWLTRPTDYLGQYLCETRGGGFNPNAFYPTPMPICEMMARMTHVDGGDYRSETCHDPCVGTGRMLLVGSNYSLRLFGQDIDRLVCLISKINLALSPWHHIPDSYFPANTIVEPDVRALPQTVAAPVARNEPKPTPFTTTIEQPMLFDLLSNQTQ